MKCIAKGLAGLTLAIGGVGAFVYFGGVNVAADVPHSMLVHRMLEKVRSRSVSVQSAEIAVPELNDEKLIRAGAIHYKEMCTGSYLAPGLNDSELRVGLTPQPPDLTRHAHSDPAEILDDQARHKDDRHAGLGKDARRREYLGSGGGRSKAALTPTGTVRRTHRS